MKTKNRLLSVLLLLALMLSVLPAVGGRAKAAVEPLPDFKLSSDGIISWSPPDVFDFDPNGGKYQNQWYERYYIKGLYASSMQIYLDRETNNKCLLWGCIREFSKSEIRFDLKTYLEKEYAEDADGKGVRTGTFFIKVTAAYRDEELPYESSFEYTFDPGTVITVEGGSADKKSATQGENVKLQANALKPGWSFNGWTVNFGGVTLADPNSMNTSFVMGSKNVKVTANIWPDYYINVTGGKADREVSHGEDVTVTADVPAGREFSHWESSDDDIEFDDEYKATTTVSFELVSPGKVYNIKAVLKAVPTSSSVSAAYAVPAAGDLPTDSAKVDGAELSSITWYRKTVTERGTFEWKPMPAGEAFLAGGEYTVEIILHPADGLIFDEKENLTVNLNGVVESQAIQEWSTTSITIRKEYAIPAEGCTIRFDPNGGSGEMDPARVMKGTKYTLPPCYFTPPEGKEFDSWDAGMPGDKIDVTADLVLKVLWKNAPVEVWAVSFAANGGSGEMETVSVVKGEKYKLPDCGFTPPEGKEFDKWDQGKPGDEIEVTDNMAVKAVWKERAPETWAVSFDAGGGSGEMKSVTVVKGEKLTLPACGFTAPEGKEFDKWDLGAPGDKVKITADTTIKAQWKDKAPETWTVSFDANGGSGKMESASVVKGEKYTLPDCGFTAPEGKEFDKWDLGAPGDKVEISDHAVLKAQWKDKPAETWVILFEAGGGSGKMESASVVKGEKYTLPECGFTPPEGKEFDKWDLGAPGDKVEISDHTVLKAQWKEKPAETWTVSFEANGGSGEMAAVTVEKGKKLTLPDCGYTPPEGQEFDKWDLGEPGEKVKISADTAVKAVWKDKPAEKKVNPFEDVEEADYFYEAVLWAFYAEPQVTNGMDATHFGPEETVTRGQAVTFLWRAMGCPEPTSTENPFEDVTEGKYYYKAVLWAVEKGITNGTDAAHFTPNQTCSTAHIITFLYRTMGIGANGWYAVAEAWAQGAGLLNGLNVTVAPGVDCPRSDVVLFLCRALAE